MAVPSADVCIGGGAVSVDMTTVDAMAVGQSLRTLARDKRTPHGTREFFDRVGMQMIAAARLAMRSQH